MRLTLFRSLTLALALVALISPATLDAAPPTQPSPAPRTPAPAPPVSAELQKEADRLFKSGVALFKEKKFGEALAEFEHAYAIAPHPLVLYNIAVCHRELSHYTEAVRYYRLFLADKSGKVPASRVTDAQTELGALLAQQASVTVIITPAVSGAQLTLDGTPLDKPAMPLILSPGEHQLIARAPGWRDYERTVRVVAGDTLAFELPLGKLPEVPSAGVATLEPGAPLVRPSPRSWLAVDAGFGMNLRRFGNTGAPSLGLGAAIGSRIGVGLDVVLVAYAVVPSVRVRVAGDALSLHVVGAVPIAFSDDPMAGNFVAIAGGLGVRYRATPRLAFRLESYVSLASKDQGMSVPTFLGGELWF